MHKKNEYEIIHHPLIPNLELFLIEIASRNPHGHSDLEIGIILSGSIELILEHERIVLQKNDIYVINRYQIHSFFKTEEKNLILAFQINAKFYKHFGSQLARVQFKNFITRENTYYNKLFHSLIDCARTYFSCETYFELKCASLLLDSLHMLSLSETVNILSEKEHSTMRNNTLRLNRITNYITEHYAEKISLEDIAQMEQISTCHLSHFFKKATGVTFQNYLNSLRFEHAYRLVTQTSLNILDICMESGFSSSRYLNQMFIKYVGLSAIDCRRQTHKPPITPQPLPTDNIQKRLSSDMAKKILPLYF